MLKNAYPFGAHINKDMMNDDYQRSNWPVLFNYGVAAVSHWKNFHYPRDGVHVGVHWEPSFLL